MLGQLFLRGWEGTVLSKNKPADFSPILCSDGSRTGCLPYTDIGFWFVDFMFWVMSVEVRQSVREQPDTG